MRDWLRYGLVGAIAYLSFLLMLWPASSVVSTVTSSVPGMASVLQLEGTQGRIWRGRIDSVRYKKHTLGALSWKLDFLPLLIGRLSAHLSLQTHDGYIRGQIASSIQPQQLELDDVQGLIPVTEVQSLYPYYPLQLGGTLSIALNNAVLDTAGKLIAASGKINLNQASVLVDREYLLGDIQTTISTLDDGRINAQLTSANGPLDLNATVTLTPDGVYRIRGKVSARQHAEAGLRKALTWLGKPDSSGNYPIRLKGRLQ